MDEETVSASHFRVHFKDIANGIAEGGRACTVERHGLAMVVVVSLEDAEFLRQHKWGKAAASKEQPQTEMIPLDHPDAMPLELLEKAYALSEGTTDFRIQRWRGKAFLSIRCRTGRYPPDGPSG